MSIVYCFNCDKPIDTDYFPEHFDDDENCVKEREKGIVDKNRIKKLESEIAKGWGRIDKILNELTEVNDK